MPEEHSFWESARNIGALITEIADSAKYITPIVAVISGLAVTAFGWVHDNPTLFLASAAGLGSFVTALITFSLVDWWHVKKDEQIAEAFCNLQDKYREFENEVVKIGFLLAVRQKGCSPIRLGDLRGLHTGYLKQLCETATTVLNAKKPFKRRIKANIKGIDFKLNPSTDRTIGNFSYAIIARSENTPQARKQADRNRLLKDNYIYMKIFDADEDKDFFLCPNLKRLVKELQKNKKTANFTLNGEPTLERMKHYKSFLTVPIMGLPGKIKSDNRLYYQYKHNDNTYDIYGLMCVDSHKYNAFNDKYDINFMSELTAQAFSAFRSIIPSLVDHDR